MITFHLSFILKFINHASESISLYNTIFIKWLIIPWYAMHQWLQNFAYKTVLSWWVFALAGIVAFVVAVFTVSWQSWRAATRNPVESLRYE
jgi:putative ABC transport system permease protein